MTPEKKTHSKEQTGKTMDNKKAAKTAPSISDSESDSDFGNENRVVQAIRKLGISRKDGEIASAMLTIMLGRRKSQRKKDFDPRARDLLSFFTYALPQVKEAQGQLFQDLWVLWELDGKKNGYFVEFGATNGLTMSNTHVLEHHHGWKGILAEPNPDYHERLGRERNCLISHKCVYSETGKTLDFIVTEKGLYSRIAEINPQDHIGAGGLRDAHRTIPVETISLEGLLDEHKAPAEIDYMSVDTEGSEYEILRNFNFEKRRIKTLTIEHNYTGLREQIYDLMTSKGYIRRFPEYTRFDDWYIHSDYAG